jgi:hypothetical protein
VQFFRGARKLPFARNHEKDFELPKVHDLPPNLKLNHY